MDEAKKTPVRLFKQKYNDYASRGLEEELDLIEIVSAVSSDQKNEDGILSHNLTLGRAEEYLRQEAEKLGATHVYGIEYQFAQPNYGNFRVYISGDAYKPKQNKNGPYR